MRIRGALLALALACAPGLGAAQQLGPQGEPVIRLPNPVLTLDWEKLFDQALWGKKIRADLEAQSKDLQQENNRIADDLIAEEKALTDRRAGMEPTEFRNQANAFDERATGIRAAQKQKAQALSQHFDDARQAFFEAVAPLLDDILAKRGAVVVLDRRAIVRGAANADVTDDLIRLVDERFGAGASQP
ncbi:OmpH family outer membrane protein [Paenirhodobacter sp.]|uniref:OmpH family outer membrane protein n=1 Tax=Paenirhodobacter sp. TaxID=1965326 RepID=UPI003B503118